MPSTRRRTDAATLEHMRRSAQRAAEDPAQLARAARIVRAALDCGTLTVNDLTDPSIGEGGLDA